MLEYSNKETPVSGSTKSTYFEGFCISTGQRWSAMRGKSDPICGVLLGFFMDLYAVLFPADFY